MEDCMRTPSTTRSGGRAGLLGLVLVLSAFASGAQAATINGTVFEDVNYGGGPGRSQAASSGQPLANVRVELYRQSNGAFVASATTNASGRYTLSTGNGGSADTPHLVRVVNGSIRSTRGTTCTTCVPVQTYRTNASSGSPVAVTNEIGGATPSLSDAAQSTSNFSTLTSGTFVAQSVAVVDPAAAGSTVNSVDFGFNFDTIVNTRDAASCTPSGTNSTFFPCQGSLRQFIVNANALGGEGSLSQAGSGQLDGLTWALPSGFESSIFMVPSASLTTGVAVITLASALPNLTGASTRLDATTQTVNVGNSNLGTLGTGGSVGVDDIALSTFQRPEVQLNAASSATTPITLAGSNQSIVGFALRQGYILLSAPNGTARNNLIGMTATGSSSDNSDDAYGIAFSSANATIRSNFVTVNNSAIRCDTCGSGAVITLNEVARPSFGHTNTFDGVLLIGGANSIQVVANLVRDQRGAAIELGHGATTDLYTNVAVQNNTVTNNGYDSGSTPSTERIAMGAYSLTGSNLVFSRNRVTNNAGPGLLVMAATGVTASQNSFSNNGGLSIDLDPVPRDPNTLGVPNGPTLNDLNDADTGPNGLLDFPVITSAVLANGQLTLAGFARPGSSIELYVAEADPSGFGEGNAYLGTLVEGSASDLDASTGTYGPGTINGVAQGTDTTTRFAYRIPVPAGVTSGSLLTATATLGGQTSEFGGRISVGSGPSLTHLKSVAVYSDPLNATTNPKSIPGALQIYTVRITNQGNGAVDNNTLAVVDAVPANTAFCVLDSGAVGSGPVAFLNGTPTSSLTYIYTALNSPADNLEFSNDGGTTWAYQPTADANGCDPAITHIRVRPQGSMAAAGGSGNPWFELRFRVRVN
jgi:hypothetical protein